MNIPLKSTLLLLALCVSTATHSQNTSLPLTDKDRKAIVQSVFNDGFDELNATLVTANILNNCLTPILNNQKVSFISTRNIESKFVPQLAGKHFEFLTPEKIAEQVKALDGECYFEFRRFEVVNSKVVVEFGKYLKRPVYIYGESFRYEYRKVQG